MLHIKNVNRNNPYNQVEEHRGFFSIDKIIGIFKYFQLNYLRIQNNFILELFSCVNQCVKYENLYQK